MKKILIIIPLVILFVSIFIIFKPKEEVISINQTPTPTSPPAIKTNLPSGGEKIEIFAFHATQRCISCLNVSKYIEVVVNEKFANEVASGKLIFKEINIDLPENKQLTKDYEVSGSSLYITVTKDNQTFKEEDTDVWRYVPYETKFKSYFEAKLKKLL